MKGLKCYHLLVHRRQHPGRRRPPRPNWHRHLGAWRSLSRLPSIFFGRSFAVTTYLQAVAIAIGLVGIAASMSAQVLARQAWLPGQEPQVPELEQPV